MFKVRKDSALGIFLALKESGSVSDFPNVMADVQHKILLDAFRGFPSQYEKWTGTGDLTDFKPHYRKWLSEAEDLEDVSNGKPYKTTKFKDRGYSIQLGTFGKIFMLLRETVLNDDLNAFKKVPASMGKAAKRSLVKQLCALIESNAAAYDGTAIFASRSISDSQGNSFTCNNQSSTALTADTNGIAAIQAGLLAIATNRDPDIGEIMGLTGKYLVVSPALAEVGRWLLRSMTLEGGATTNGMAMNPMGSPALTAGNQPLELVVDPFLTKFPNRWYIFADPNDAPAFEVGYLDGQKEPQLFQKASEALIISGGGRDDFGYDYDDISFKVRWDWAVAAAFFQACFKGGS